MRYHYALILAALSVTAYPALGIAAESAGTDAEAQRATFETLAARFDAAWNGRDPDALAELLTADADVRYWTGETLATRDAIRAAYASRIFPATPAGMVHRTRLDTVRFVAPDVAVGDGMVTIGVPGSPPDGPPEMSPMFTSVAVREGDAWRIAAIRLMMPRNR